MTMRLQKVLIGLLAILSLGAGSVSACICSHHERPAETQRPSCHSHSDARPEAAQDVDAPQLTETQDCGCEAVAKAVTKADPLKFSKHAAAAESVAALTVSLYADADTYRPVFFEKPCYLSDSFYNLAPKRGPPTL